MRNIGTSLPKPQVSQRGGGRLATVAARAAWRRRRLDLGKLGLARPDLLGRDDLAERVGDPVPGDVKGITDHKL